MLNKQIQGIAVYDLITTACFAIPGVSALVIDLYANLHHYLQLTGSFPDFSAGHLLFVNLAGIMMIGWAGLRFSNPSVKLMGIDGFMRLGYCSAFSYAYFIGNVSPLILIYLFVDSLIAVWEIVATIQHRAELVAAKA